MSDVNNPNQPANHSNKLREHSAKFVEFPFQWRRVIRVIHRIHGILNFPNCRRICTDNDAVHDRQSRLSRYMPCKFYLAGLPRLC